MREQTGEACIQQQPPTRRSVQRTCPDAASGPCVFLRHATVRIGCSSAASAATWALTTHCGLGSVASSSMVGLAAGVVLPSPLATAAFCGTFAGMSSRAVAPRAADAAVLGGAAAALLVALDATRLLKGVGGRLGTVAALAVLARVATAAELRAAGLLYVPSLAVAATAPKTLLTTVGATVVGAAATRLWAQRLAALLRCTCDTSSALGAPSAPPLTTAGSRREALARRLSNPVASASVVGLCSSLALEPTRTALAASVFAGTFVAMCAPHVLGSMRAILGAAALAGFAQVGLAALCVGGGGKLGAAAAIGVLLLRLLLRAGRAAAAARAERRERCGRRAELRRQLPPGGAPTHGSPPSFRPSSRPPAAARGGEVRTAASETPTGVAVAVAVAAPPHSGEGAAPELRVLLSVTRAVEVC